MVQKKLLDFGSGGTRGNPRGRDGANGEKEVLKKGYQTPPGRATVLTLNV